MTKRFLTPFLFPALENELLDRECNKRHDRHWLAELWKRRIALSNRIVAIENEIAATKVQIARRELIRVIEELIELEEELEREREERRKCRRTWMTHKKSSRTKSRKTSIGC